MVNYKYTNRLIHETSPYLVQHGHNPVDWYPWGEEALSLAKKENKVIFLSIGYSACHWCHVMEKESFENEETARLMNALFVCIKVDREERPDLDEIYMTAVQIMSGSGGWPLSVWLTPELEPIYGGTYFPPEERWGRPGFSDVLTMIDDLWRLHPGNALSAAAAVKHTLRNLNVLQKTEGDIGIDLWHRAFDGMTYRFDKKNGGFGSHPKFPQPMGIAFLLRYYFHTGNASALEMAEKTLQAMALGGMFDQVGGGFHRYSTDEKWFVPHFEKMLYDNALLASVYLEAYQITRNEFYADIARAVFNYVLRDMTSPEGAFYASQDADSEGEEGKFYVWSLNEMEDILGKEDAAIVSGYFGVTRAGNWEGRNILYRPLNDHAYAESTGLDGQSLTALIARSRETLRTVRARRIAPATDDKIITSWNSLMISALCKGYQVLNEPAYLDAAKKAVAFLIEKMYINSVILRIYRKSQRQTPGYLSDYANLTAALLDLYESSFEWVYLQRAIEINELLLNKFWDVNEGGFFFTSSDHERLIVRTRNIFDHATPGGNSVAVHNLFRLSEFTGDGQFRDKAVRTLQAFRDSLETRREAFPMMLCALDFLWGAPKQIVISGDRNSNHFEEMVSAIHSYYLPNKIVAYADSQLETQKQLQLPLLIGKFSSAAVHVYVCENFTCQQPIQSKSQFDDYYSTVLKKV